MWEVERQEAEEKAWRKRWSEDLREQCVEKVSEVEECYEKITALEEEGEGSKNLRGMRKT